MVRIENNTATLALIDQRYSGLTNFLTRIIDPSTISVGTSISTAVGSLISGLDTPEARTLASLTEQFLGGATAAVKSKTCWGCLKPECPGWFSKAENKVVCRMANDPTRKARAEASRALLIKKIQGKIKKCQEQKDQKKF